jgi:hypothetical protein
MELKQKLFISFFVGLIILITSFAAWRTPITKYKPKTIEEQEISELFIKYITARNNRNVKAFLSVIHNDCKYMITKDFIASKEQLEAKLPSLWMQNDDNNAAFGRCMAWECWHENYYRNVMLINPKFRISDHRANVNFKIVSGLFMDDNYFQLVKDNDAWKIIQFMRPIY